MHRTIHLDGATTEKRRLTPKNKTTRSRNRSTQYITVDTSKCEACWACIDECQYNVLGKINILFHKHIKIKNGEECRGCRKCVAVCPNGVFQPINIPGHQ